jgi:hypothetical protein
VSPGGFWVGNVFNFSGPAESSLVAYSAVSTDYAVSIPLVRRLTIRHIVFSKNMPDKSKIKAYE